MKQTPIRTSRHLALVTTLFAGAGCVGETNSGDPLATSSVADVQVTLQRVELPNGVDTIFWSSESSLGLFRSGQLGVLGPALGREHGRLHILNPTNGSLLTVGHLGAGPGELSGSGLLVSGDNVLTVADDGRGVVLSFDSLGTAVRQFPALSPTGFLLAAFGDSLDLLAFRWVEGADSPIIQRHGPNGPAGRLVISDAEGGVRDYVTGWQSGRRARRIPGYTANDSLLVIGDPVHYTLYFFHVTGTLIDSVTRDLPPLRREAAARSELEASLRSTVREYGRGSAAGRSAVERLDTLEQERLPHFFWPGMGFDDAGRLWVVGEVGDSAFADLFVDRVFVSRTVLPCSRPRRRVAIRGRWIALHCEVAESDSSPFQLQLYRIG